MQFMSNKKHLLFGYHTGKTENNYLFFYAKTGRHKAERVFHHKNAFGSFCSTLHNQGFRWTVKPTSGFCSFLWNEACKLESL